MICTTHTTYTVTNVKKCIHQGIPCLLAHYYRSTLRVGFIHTQWSKIKNTSYAWYTLVHINCYFSVFSLSFVFHFKVIRGLSQIIRDAAQFRKTPVFCWSCLGRRPSFWVSLAFFNIDIEFSGYFFHLQGAYIPKTDSSVSLWKYFMV